MKHTENKDGPETAENKNNNTPSHEREMRKTNFDEMGKNSKDLAVL